MSPFQTRGLLGPQIQHTLFAGGGKTAFLYQWFLLMRARSLTVTASPPQPVISLTEEAAEAQGAQVLADSRTVIKNDGSESRLCDTPTTLQQPPLVSPRLSFRSSCSLSHYPTGSRLWISAPWKNLSLHADLFLSLHFMP